MSGGITRKVIVVTLMITLCVGRCSNKERIKRVMKHLEGILRRIAFSITLGLASVLFSSCSSQGVRWRSGSVPKSFATIYLDPHSLGEHNGFFEKGGQIYTCEAGLIDLDHLRNSADFTNVFSRKIFNNMMKGEEEFSLKMPEPSKFFIELSYPEYWDKLSVAEKEKIANEVSIRLGAYVSYTGTTWREILTWFGYRAIIFIPEFESAFSVEDSFSDLLGTHLAEKVLTENKEDFSSSLTKALNEELQKLKVKSAAVAKKAARNTDRKRNLDIGLDDGYVTPWILPLEDVPESLEAKPRACPFPNLDILSKHGFSMKFEIEPRELFEKGKILRVAGKNKRIDPQTDFPVIMNYIKEQAVNKYQFDVNVPYSDSD